MIAPHEACKGIQFAATTGSTTRKTKSVTVAPRIKINRIAQYAWSPSDLVAQLSLARVFKLGVAAVIPVAHRPIAPVGPAIPVILRTAADLSPELVATALPA